MSPISSLNVNLRVRKADGGVENFSSDKIITSCMNVGASFIQASTIASEIADTSPDLIPTTEIRKRVYEKLAAIDLSMAEQYMYRLHMNVKTSKTTLESFDAKKISDSLTRETGLDRSYSDLIAREVEKELARMHLKHVTAPLIREIVNVKLLEHGLESTRARYTRLGMPVYDVSLLIKDSGNANQMARRNPETIHRLMADQISREYALLDVLPTELADAHMSGRLHIHDLDYYPLRPMGFCHDLRYFLKNGLKPDGTGGHAAVSGPAKKPAAAFMHAANVLLAAQTNCSGGQGLSYFNVYLAPYVRGLDKSEVRQLVQMFVYELNQMHASGGLETACCSMDFALGVPSVLARVPAVQPGGLLDSAAYGAFERESLMLLDAFSDVLLRGDYAKRPFQCPRMNVHLSRGDLEKPVMEGLLSLVLNHRSPCFIVDQLYTPSMVSYHLPLYIMPALRDNVGESLAGNYPRGGCMHAVTINLPQIAYEVNGDDDKLVELLELWIKRARDILLLKINLMENNLQSGLLSFMSQKVNDKERYLEPAQQNHAVSFVGLNEMVKAHTGMEMHDKDGLEFGMRFVEKMSLMVKNLSDVSGLNFVLADATPDSFSTKMARTDLANHPKAVVNGEGESVYYTNSFRMRSSVKPAFEDCIGLESMFSPLMNGGSLSKLALHEMTPDAVSKAICDAVKNTEIQYLTFA
jgi:ribonucleoside-triphosphate reductase